MQTGIDLIFVKGTITYISQSSDFYLMSSAACFMDLDPYREKSSFQTRIMVHSNICAICQNLTVFMNIKL